MPVLKPKSILVALFAAVVYLVSLLGFAAEGGSYENLQERIAADILPAELLNGEHHSADYLVRLAHLRSLMSYRKLRFFIKAAGLARSA